MKKKVYLTLENGDVFQGYRFGANGEAIGELVFSTSMVGYVETLTDPSNFGQAVVQTFPLIGNYGVMPADAESDKVWASAFIVREVCDAPSNFRCEGTLDDYLKENGVVGVYGVDTRELTKTLREQGAMNVYIGDKPLTEEGLVKLRAYSIKDGIKTVAPTQKNVYGDDTATFSVALWNMGTKKSIIDDLLAQGWRVIDMPAFSTAEEIVALNVDGVVIGDGAGNPEENQEIISEIKKLVGKIPMFGIGLGYQLLAVALGAKTAKQKHGHRGGNQPVKCVESGKVYISTQNHGYEVLANSLKQGKVSFINVNDGSCEGVDYDEYKAFGVQFMPQSCGIGHVENAVYNKFLTLMKKEKENA